MPRTIPALPRRLSPPEEQSLSLKVEVITPLFGGSARPREVNETHPVRAASVRGHLRFWWRATTGAAFGSAADLFNAESRLWGSTEQPGQVRVEVQVLNQGESMPCAEPEPNGKGGYKALPRFLHQWPPYALHPFQGQDYGKANEIPPAHALVGVTFLLKLSGPRNALEEVQPALAAWLKYGGLGARTRRGCGSVASDWQDPDAGNLAEKADGSRLTVLAGSRQFAGSKTDKAVAAWRAAVELYRDFRQNRQKGFARNPGQNQRPGRSRWPEPDSVRRLVGHHSPRHSPRKELPNGYPRAELGLPIIFHFKDNREGDPDQATLQGPRDGQRRFASPVITRAIKVEGGYRPLLLILNAPHVWDFGPLDLKCEHSRASISQEQIRLTPAERAQVHPLGKNETREALAAYVLSQGWQEVSA